MCQLCASDPYGLVHSRHLVNVCGSRKEARGREEREERRGGREGKRDEAGMVPGLKVPSLERQIQN